MKSCQWNMWKSMVETEWNSDVIFHRWKQGVQTGRILPLFKIKQSASHLVFFSSPSLSSCSSFLVLLLLLLSTALDDLIRSDQDCWRCGMKISWWRKPCQPAVIFSHIYCDSLLRLLTLAPNSSWISSFPGLWPLPPLCPRRKNSCWWNSTERRTDFPRRPVRHVAMSFLRPDSCDTASRDNFSLCLTIFQSLNEPSDSIGFVSQHSYVSG